VVLSVDIGEERGLVQAFAQERALTFPILLDENGSVTRTYGVRAVPASFFIDRQGVIRIRHIGPLGESLIARYLEPIL
jgi:peroxiredoxin